MNLPASDSMRAKHLQPLPKNPTRFRARPIIEPPTANAPKLHLQRSLRGGPSSPSLVGPAAGWEGGPPQNPSELHGNINHTRHTEQARLPVSVTDLVLVFPHGTAQQGTSRTHRDSCSPQAAQGVRGSGPPNSESLLGITPCSYWPSPTDWTSRTTSSTNCIRTAAETSRGRGSWITASHRATRGRRMNYP